MNKEIGKELKDLSAVELLEWIQDERNLLQNTASLMWHKPEEQKNTMVVAECLSKSVKYIKLSFGLALDQSTLNK